MKRSLRLLGAPLLAAALLAGGAGPASAGETHTWTNRHAKPTSAGYAKGHLHIEWLSRRTVDFDGWVLDMCPGDTNSAMLHVDALVRRRNGEVVKRGWLAWEDKDGCAARTKKRFDPAPKRVRRGAVIVALRAELYEKRPTGGVNDWPYFRYSIKRFKNWRV